MRKRYSERVENVDFEKLRKCLKNHGIKQSELSIACGYYPEYIKDVVLPRHVLNTHVRDVLTYAYKVDPSEYTDTQPKEVTDTADIQPKYVRKEVTDIEDDDMYQYTFSFNGEFLKKLALGAMKYHISIENFIYKCLVEGIGDKIKEFEKTERKN